MPRRDARRGELGIEEADVELGVVDHELRAVNEGEELLGDLRERGLCGEEFIRDAVDGERARVHFAARASGNDASRARLAGDARARRSRSR